MIDLREHKNIDLSEATTLKEEAAYLFKDNISGKNLVAKFIGYYDDKEDEYLLGEFKKLFILSAEPEIGTVYYLATSIIKGVKRNCYVMDYVQGKTIGNLHSENETLSTELVISIIKQLASGLEKAHNYEVSHGDLHEANIIIDNFGYLKVFDFAFWGNKIDFEKNVHFDIKCFNEIIRKLIDKCPKHDVTVTSMILDLCNSIKSFKDLRHHIHLIEKVAFDFNLLDEIGKVIISLIIQEVPFDITLSLCLTEKDIEIPYNPEFEQTEQEKMYMEKENDATGKLRLKYSDQRMARIEEHIQNIFTKRLHQLKQAGLIDWEVWVSNSGQKFLGPYNYNYQIFLTPKLLKWKKTNSIISFLPDVTGTSLTQKLIE
ncbi:MAG: protein kinase [Chitinophagales bacterium]|nr:protein kinase [Chitinophagales bacterium]